MRTFLVVDNLQMTPGIYSVQLSNKSKEFIERYRSFKFRIDKIYNKIKADTLKRAKENYDLLKIDNFFGRSKEKNPKLPFSVNEMIYFTNSIQYKNEINELNESLPLFYDEKFFEGYFESEEHFKLIFPSNRNAELILVDRDFVNKYFKETKNIQSGLNVELHGCNSLVPIADISKTSWTKLMVIIRDVFDNLGAKEIHIKDTTDINANVELDFKKVKSLIKTDIKFDLVHDFKLDTIKQQGYYNPSATEHLIPILEKYAPHFAQTAKEQIRNRSKEKFEIVDNIDVSFGVSVDVVAVFQGAFKGGFKRNFSMEVTFG